MPKNDSLKLVPMMSVMLFWVYLGLSTPSFGQEITSPPTSELSAVVTLMKTSGYEIQKMDNKIETIGGELDKADHRTRQTEQYTILLLVISGLWVALMILGFIGIIGRSSPKSHKDLIILKTLHVIHKRQRELKLTITSLKLYMAQINDDRSELAKSLAIASKNILKI